MSAEPIEIYDPSRASSLGVRSPALFLSASVPYQRSEGTPEQLASNSRYLPPLSTEIRTAVVQLARFAFARDVQLVFGGHPAISPLVLQSAHAAPASSVPRVFIFQSAYFRHRLPPSTLELAQWPAGRVVWTAAEGTPPSSAADAIDPEDRARSLTRMREAMVQLPGLVGALVIGGMDGVEEEAALWRQHGGNRPLYALPATGGAARILFDVDPRGHAGGVDPAALDTTLFPRAIGRIFEDLGLP